MYWFTPGFTATHYLSPRHSLAEAIISSVKQLSYTVAGGRPSLGHSIANALLLPILTNGSDLRTPNSYPLRDMNSFWHRVRTYPTNNLCATPTSILVS